MPPTNTSLATAQDAATTAPALTDRDGLPDAPVAKPDISPSAEAPAAIEPFVPGPAKPGMRASYETARTRRTWYGLIAVSHGAAAFDAWSTRRALSSGYGVEADPFLRPFAHSNALYAATQVSPAVMDYIGHRMMTSDHTVLRRFWWVPQAAGATFSFGAGFHNYRLVP